MPPPYRDVYRDERFRFDRPTCVVCNKATDEQFRWHHGMTNHLPTDLVLEPSGHDTAPAIALAAREARARDADALLVVAPTDHFIGDEAAFRAALAAGIDAAATGSLVTFGVRPDHPATGFGYIEHPGRS